MGYRDQKNAPLLLRRMRGEEAFVSSGHFTKESAIIEVKRYNGRGLVINVITTSVGMENYLPVQEEDRRGSARALDSMWCGLPCLPLHLACKKRARTMDEMKVPLKRMRRPVSCVPKREPHAWDSREDASVVGWDWLGHRLCKNNSPTLFKGPIAWSTQLERS
jgi:hypothetical protein